MEVLAVPVLLAVGGLLALQAAPNVQLSAAMASPLGASTLRLGLGAVLLLALAVVAGSLGAFVLLDRAEPWHLVGGLVSAVYITAGILLFPRLGALVTVGLFIAGQMLASLALDGFGWLGVAHVTSVFLLVPQLGAAPVVALTVGGSSSPRSPSTATAGCGWPAAIPPSAASSGSPSCSPA
jgi:bacterial/archaeal transporter family-2 protein